MDGTSFDGGRRGDDFADRNCIQTRRGRLMSPWKRQLLVFSPSKTELSWEFLIVVSTGF